jgi:hypothetical protein
MPRNISPFRGPRIFWSTARPAIRGFYSVRDPLIVEVLDAMPIRPTDKKIPDQWRTLQDGALSCIRL